MLLKLLAIVMKGQLKQKIPLNLEIQQNRNKSPRVFTQIRIMDSTEFLVSKKVAAVFPGYGGKGREAIVQVQYEYDIVNHNITQLSVGSALDSDALEGMKEIDSVPKGSLLIRDLGYNSPKAFKELTKRELFFISRAKPQWSMLIKGENGKLVKITPLQIIEQLKELQNLGVLQGRDEAILIQQLSNPTSLMTYIKGLGGPDYFFAKVKELKSKAERELSMINRQFPVPVTGQQQVVPAIPQRFQTPPGIGDILKRYPGVGG